MVWGIIKRQAKAVKVSWLWLFYNLAAWDILFRCLSSELELQSCCQCFPVCTSQKAPRVAKWLHDFSVYSEKLFINIKYDTKCARKATPSLHFIFFFGDVSHRVSTEKKLLLYHLHDGKKKFLCSLCRALLITFFLSTWIFHEAEGIA